MNYLAHLLLSGSDPQVQVGGLLGDFLKGPVPASLPARVAQGVILHREIDRFTDSHPLFLRSRARISPERQRLGGILVDVFYDHFLALDWDAYSPEPLDHFASAAYAVLAAHQHCLPDNLVQALPTMRSQNWLLSYRDPTGIGTTIDRIAARRAPRLGRLVGGVEEMLADYQGFRDDFHAFFPAVQALAEAHLEKQGVSH
ncbi:acyl carrier protein phosphodiesterase [Chitinimonas lacunae]|uniref:ACP phosphodiesterase n=1 Tax=Chitinimonas lacunae TaxID=1963018 RepID=A0ABV8MMR9_9NEIS